ncbi:flagella synthesis protein FlgN [Chromatocurvus halotolerans]|uniref:FlgN protein n=1 Tax=Chromatocurvus halotolerans TaxID=1132028 RepID=A0A4R2KUW9_9GAMM|nr:flagellar protein FlgN [Chromatocurvus halotolerans]TCO76627.1 FlgN protein [Chromatocurvus halotolerans]
MLQSPARFATALADMLQAQRECATQLLQILERERAALDDGDLVAMDTASADKTAALAGMEQLKSREDQLLAGTPFSNSDTPFEQALAWCDASGAVRAVREDVSRLMIDCDRSNRRNGLLVQHRLNYVRRAIDILHAAHAETLVYGPDGMAHSGGSSRLLAEG